MLINQLTFGFFWTVLLLSLGLFYLYFKNQFDKKFLYAGLFFLFGSGFLFSSYITNLSALSTAAMIFWNRFMFACIFSYFFVFPAFVYNTIGRDFKKSLCWVLGIFSSVIIVLTITTELLVQKKILIFAGVYRPLKTKFTYFLLLLLSVWASYIFYDSLKFLKKSKPAMIDVRPMIVGIIIAVILGLIDIIGTYLNRPFILQIRDPFIFGIFAIMLTFAWTFLSQYALVFASLNKSKEEIERLIAKSNKNFMEFVQLIAKTLDAKDEYTAGHSLRVQEYALKIADELNLSETDKEILKQACLLHDIGKIGIPDGILNKKSPLTEQEKRYIINHPILGKKILSTVSEFRPILDIVYSHHERVDGKGYPQGLDRDKIPLLARIIAVADTYDAITSARPYRRAKRREEAIEELIKAKGTQLDEQLVDIFLKSLAKES
ncbi:MAG: HD domain-containing phosphohydrolase [candidate division WOR-3 bacterium]